MAKQKATTTTTKTEELREELKEKKTKLQEVQQNSPKYQMVEVRREIRKIENGAREKRDRIAILNAVSDPTGLVFSIVNMVKNSKSDKQELVELEAELIVLLAPLDNLRKLEAYYWEEISKLKMKEMEEAIENIQAKFARMSKNITGEIAEILGMTQD